MAINLTSLLASIFASSIVVDLKRSHRLSVDYLGTRNTALQPLPMGSIESNIDDAFVADAVAK